MVVDDAADFRRVARLLLESAGYDVVGEAADGAEAVTVARELQPDLVLLDVQLPDVDGFEVARQLEQQGGMRVVLVSSREADDFGPRLHTAAAVGFLAKRDLSGLALNSLLGSA